MMKIRKLLGLLLFAAVMGACAESPTALEHNPDDDPDCTWVDGIFVCD